MRHPSGEDSFTAAPPGPRRTVSHALVVREYEPLNGLREDEQRDLERFALAQSTDEWSQRRAVFALRNGRLHAQNYVGIIETHRGTVIGVFLAMLRDWRGLGEAQLDSAGIRAIRHMDMFEAFVHLFLASVVLLTQRGFARAYRTREANLSCMRGRIQARFILDAKWKRLDPDAANHGVSQDDAYQLFAYGKRYGCRRVVLVYPRTTAFRETLHFRFVEDHDLEMVCFPFNVADSAGAVGAMMRELR